MGFEQDGRMTKLLRDDLDASKFFKDVGLPEQDIQDITAVGLGARFMQNNWMFGLAPDHSCATLAPNSASMVRVLAQGEIHIIMFELTEFEKHVRVGATLDDLCSHALKLNATTAAPLTGYHTILRPNETLFMPQGWIVCEKTSKALCSMACASRT